MAAPAPAPAPAPSPDAGAEPQLYLQELALQDCSCQPPPCLPRWNKWSAQSHSGQRKPHPQHRGGHASVWIGPSRGASSSAGSVLLFGGSNREATTFADTWRFDLHTNEWSQPPLVGPSPPLRSGHSLVYDASSHRVILYGGQQMRVDDGGEMDLHFLRDVWTLDCNRWTWTKLADAGDAPQRNGHSAVLLSSSASSSSSGAAASPCMLVFGGSDASGPSNALWRYDLASMRWESVATAGAAPEGRELHAACMVRSPVEDEHFMIISGGRGEGALLNTCYALRIPTSGRWTWNLVGQCPARCAHSMVPMHVQATAPALPVMTPAVSGSSAASAASAADAATTTTPSPAAAPASPAPASCIPLLLFGGTDGAMFYNDVLSFSLDVATLSPDALAPPPACPQCQGPPGWTMLIAPEKAQQGQGQGQAEAEGAAAAAEGAAAASGAAAPAAGGSSTAAKKKKRKKKRGGGMDVQPAMCFAHTLTPLPFASPAFAAAAGGASASAATDAAPSAATVPGTFLLFGGLNDESDLDDTHFLALTHYKH